MPELPEVEVVRAGLVPAVLDRIVEAVDVLHPRPVRRHPAGPEDFASAMIGRKLAEPRRRGKFLWIPFADGDALVCHLGMSGQFRVDSPGTERLRHTRIVFRFADCGPELRFVDQRMFGGLWLSPGGAEAPADLAHVAPDLLEPGIDLGNVAASVRRHRSGIKRVLLDQRVVSGIGNIYADEALWRARVHYDIPAYTMSPARVRRLLEAARQVMIEALAVGGTSFDALYVNVNGSSGYFSRQLHSYGREGEPCDRCGSLIKRAPFMNRSSFYCPRCQRRR